MLHSAFEIGRLEDHLSFEIVGGLDDLHVTVVTDDLEVAPFEGDALTVRAAYCFSGPPGRNLISSYRPKLEPWS